MRKFIEDQTFIKIIGADSPLEKAEYENCIFSECDFSSSSLNSIVFSNCEFNECNLSMAKISDTAFRSVKFNQCKLAGLQFDGCNSFLLEMIFLSCNLNYASFYQVNLKNTDFSESTIQEADFTEANLAGSVFNNCDLQNAVFDRTNLMGANLATASNYLINPTNNVVKNARFSYPGMVGLLASFNVKIVK